MIRFRVTDAQVPTAAPSDAEATTWFVYGLAEDGATCAGYMPRDEVPGVHDARQLLGYVVQGQLSQQQRQAGRKWVNYCTPVKVTEDGRGAIAELHEIHGHMAYRKTMNDAVSEISARMKDIADQINKTAALLRSLNNL